jgi:DNA-binding transcriptional LysR family regulator
MDVLRSFVSIVETGSMTKASERECVTQSALSLRMTKLEEITERQLFLRLGGRLKLSPAGAILLEFARKLIDLNDQALAALTTQDLRYPVRLGIVQDFAESLLSGVLARFSYLHPSIHLEVRVLATTEMLRKLDANELDIVVGFGHDDDPRCVRQAPMFWIGNPTLFAADVIPLAMLNEPCLYRESALSSLARAGREFRIAIETPDVTTLRAAVDAGLGVTCRSEMFGSSKVHISNEMPALPNVGCVLASRADPEPPIAALIEIVRETLSRSEMRLTAEAASA